MISYNSNVEAEIISEHNDPFKLEFTDVSQQPDVVIGERVGVKFRSVALTFSPQALKIADPRYVIRYPLRHNRLNTADYSSMEMCLTDLEAIWCHLMERELKVERGSWQVRVSGWEPRMKLTH